MMKDIFSTKDYVWLLWPYLVEEGGRRRPRHGAGNSDPAGPKSNACLGRKTCTSRRRRCDWRCKKPWRRMVVSRRDLFWEFLLCLQKESKIGCSVSHATSITGLPFHNFFIFLSKNRLFFKNKRSNIMTLAIQLSRSPADSKTTANYQRSRKTTIFFVASSQLF